MKKTKAPINQGKCKVPVVMQLEALECGAACLAMILAYYDKWIPLEQIRADCGVSRDGSNAKNMLKAARYYGLQAKGYRYEVDSIQEDGQFPCIIHWGFNHFVVLNGFKHNKAYLNDPARGEVSVDMETFDEQFTGIVLNFAPSETFEPSGKQKSMIEFVKRRLKGSEPAIIFTIATSIIVSLMGVISPGFSKVFIDRLLTQSNPEWAEPFLIVLTVFALIKVVMSIAQVNYSRKINGKMSAVGSTSYMWKVLQLPINFFSQRMAGDIQSRQYVNASIANTLINILAPIGIDVIMLIVYLVVMLRYNVALTIVGITALTINMLMSRYISAKRINLTRVTLRDQAKLSSTTVSGIEMIETIKSSGAENGFFAKWSGYQASVNSQNVKFSKQEKYLNLIPSFINTLANNLVLIFGIYLTMNGEFTLGMINAFTGYLGSFMSPALSIISAGQSIQEMRTEMERVDDVMDYPCDNIFKADEENDDFTKLSGNIEIKNLTFGYSKLADPFIIDFNMKLEPGKSVALVGGSGCGKSTMSKLISGLQKPWSGEILFDGKPTSQINKSVFVSSLAVVDQDIILFEDTIENNIKMWDESIEDFEMILAARDAQIHDDIMERVGGYQHKVIEGGKDFSGGQRQRLEIARVLAQDPTIIILDEATSALDALTEYEVVKAIKNRGISCIVVAHRLSTIKNCDEIIVMDKGRIVDRGTHKELMKTSELYQKLVVSE
ncbi:MAG: NHLP family bacteriocin export ABC transporter peptidase/permease/ATPase subunit [Erysipelotrichaceae bacterium]|nr:NHLP family bacteriocin export ABC transporter peptidase/permease/ATPase subunit [Erysipelotrichaceae bacterium]